MATVTLKIHTCRQIATLWFNDRGIESSVPICSKDEGYKNILFLLRQGAISQKEHDRVEREISESPLPDFDEEDEVEIKNCYEEEDNTEVPLLFVSPEAGKRFVINPEFSFPCPVYEIFRTERQTPLCLLLVVKKN
ncbi:MAG: hypothetical protein RJA61_699 [Candidatus Parcubacteria bacterium]